MTGAMMLATVWGYYLYYFPLISHTATLMMTGIIVNVVFWFDLMFVLKIREIQRWMDEGDGD